MDVVDFVCMVVIFVLGLVIVMSMLLISDVMVKGDECFCVCILCVMWCWVMWDILWVNIEVNLFLVFVWCIKLVCMLMCLLKNVNVLIVLLFI